MCEPVFQRPFLRRPTSVRIIWAIKEGLRPIVARALKKAGSGWFIIAGDACNVPDNMRGCDAVGRLGESVRYSESAFPARWGVAAG